MAITASADTGNRVSPVRRAGFPARLCAAVALGSVGAHVWMAWEHRGVPWEAALMFLMAAACLPCAVSVWRRGHERAVQLLFGMALAMVGVHAVLLLAPGSMAGHGHGGMGAMASMPAMPAIASMPAMADGGLAGAMSQPASMLCIVALELAVAMLAAWVMRRSRTCVAD
ncbi:hypothetical protein [Arthrobacter dokdonensis]|uniref:hypothetical protein n=1 Tax=Arthrobacter dokdonellae TaxID=2211210 RepID=UPI000DE58BFF|nr:hypothetical protein [Arthrobacter dokdonellae]